MIRFEGIIGNRIGHLAANMELYLCERDVNFNTPQQRYLDFFYIRYGPVCNKQLLSMLKRKINFVPKIFIEPLYNILSFIPKCKSHLVGHNINNDRDILNLLSKTSSHFEFTNEEEKTGQLFLEKIGIENSSFICLNVRDSAYLSGPEWTYHNFRDSSIENYELAILELVERGYFVIRMGAKVNSKLRIIHPKVIDYATNGMRSEFLDIYLGSKCLFCISTGSGWEVIPRWIFRRPLCYVNHVPLGYICTFLDNAIILSKHYYSQYYKRLLNLTEIFENNIGLIDNTQDFQSNNIKLIENTPEEILGVVIEMEERLTSKWIDKDEDIDLQNHFWNNYPIHIKDSYNRKLHGKLMARYSTTFLRNNKSFVKC